MRYIFKRILLYALALSLLGGLGAIAWVEYQMRVGRGTYVKKVDPAQFQGYKGPIAITQVHVLAPDASHMIPNQTVLIDQGIIQAVGSSVVIPEGTKMLDGQGQYLIPGLVDSHVHLEKTPNDLLLYVALGVTSIRDMGANDTQLAMRKAIEEGQLGPHMLVSTNQIFGESGLRKLFSSWTRSRINIADPEDVEAAVLRYKHRGFDSIKVGDVTPAEVYRSISKAAHKHELPITGHIPTTMDLEEFWTIGQAEASHVEEFLKVLIREYGSYYHKDHDAFLHFVKERGPELARNIKKHGMVVASTVWIIQSIPGQKFQMDQPFHATPLAFANPAMVEGTKLRKGWIPGNNRYEANPEAFGDPKAAALEKKFWETYSRGIDMLTEIFANHGVTLLAGTDTGGPLLVPGFSLHDELAYLTQCGMTPSQVLYSATVAPNRWNQRKAGVIQQGYLADLILLRQNPLEDMSHTRTIESVFVKGRWLDRALLRDILKAVRKANDQSRRVDIDQWQHDSRNIFE